MKKVHISKPARRQQAKATLPSFAGPNLSSETSMPNSKALDNQSTSDQPHFDQATEVKRASAVLLTVVGLAGAAWFAFQILMPSSPPIVSSVPPVSQHVQAKEPVQKSSYVLPKSDPAHLSIPDVGIDTDIIVVGKQSDGTMEVPTDPNVVGWYKYGPTPGELGPSVIVGHLDSPHDVAVFWRLHELTPGQRINIQRADGTNAEFTVDSLKQFDQDNFPTAEVYGNIDHAGLRLITCGGEFNRVTHHYSQNTVVYASMVTP